MKTGFPLARELLTFCHRDSRDAREEQAATNQQFPTWPWCKSWELIPSTKRCGSSQISCGMGEKQRHWVSKDVGKSGARPLSKGKSLPLFLRLHLNPTCSFLLASFITLVAGGPCPAFCSHQDMGNITAEVMPDLLPILFQHQHRFAIIIPGDNDTFSHHYSPSDPSPLLSSLFVISHKPFSSLYSVTALPASPSLILLWRA